MLLKPLVSVMMPAYNAEDTILRALNSLVNQTYSNWECIVVDDGSIDKTSYIVNSIDDSRIKLIRLHKNMGRGYARQIALDNTSGEYIAMLDADDWYYDDKLEKQVKIFINHPEVTLVSCGMAIENPNSVIVGIRLIGDDKVRSFDKPSKVPVPHAPSMYRASKLKAEKYDYRLKLGQDTDFIRRILINESYILLDYIGYVYGEYSSNNPIKTIKSYSYSSISYLKFFKDYPLTSSYNSILEVMKIPRALLYSIFGQYDKLLATRSKSPNKKQIEEFNKQKSKLHNISSKALN